MAENDYGLWNFGAGVWLYSLERYRLFFALNSIEETKRLLNSIGCPVLEDVKGTQFVNHSHFIYCITAITGPRGRNFKLGKDFIDPKEDLDYEQLTTFLLLSKRLEDVTPDAWVFKRIRDAEMAARTFRSALDKAGMLDAASKDILPPIPGLNTLEVLDAPEVNQTGDSQEE